MVVSLKKQEQKLIAKKLNLFKNAKFPLLSLNLQYFNHDFETELPDLLIGLKNLNTQIVVEPSFHGTIKKHLSGLPVCAEDHMPQVAKATSMTLFLSDDDHIGSLISLSLRNEIVPICYNFKKYERILIDYDPITEQGNSFLFKEFSKWHIFAAVARALENYRFSFDWEGIVRDGVVAAMKLK